MKTSLRKDSRDRRQRDGWDCRKLLVYEKKRSERHNRFFSLCGLKFTGTQGEELASFLRDDLRASDYIFQVPSADKTSPLSGKIGLLLPETDLAGGEIVRDRIYQLCRAGKFQVQIGLAIYPDDATALGEILEKAFVAVLPGGGGEKE